jgi:hypothetical protein
MCDPQSPAYRGAPQSEKLDLVIDNNTQILDENDQGAVMQMPTSPIASTISSNSKLAELGLSPMILKNMVERNPSSTPLRSPRQGTAPSSSSSSVQRGSPVKKIGFHMRSPVGKK